MKWPYCFKQTKKKHGKSESSPQVFATCRCPSYVQLFSFISCLGNPQTLNACIIAVRLFLLDYAGDMIDHNLKHEILM